MILIDANLLIYATTPGSDRSEQSRRWLDKQICGDGRVGLPWHSILAYLRVVTDRRIFSQPDTLSTAWAQIDRWLQCERVWIPAPGPLHPSILAMLLTSVGVGPKLISDAHLAAIAIEHNLTLCSADRDFARFPGLRWSNPLSADH